MLFYIVFTPTKNENTYHIRTLCVNTDRVTYTFTSGSVIQESPFNGLPQVYAGIRFTLHNIFSIFYDLPFLVHLASSSNDFNAQEQNRILGK